MVGWVRLDESAKLEYGRSSVWLGWVRTWRLGYGWTGRPTLGRHLLNHAETHTPFTEDIGLGELQHICVLKTMTVLHRS